MPTPKEQQPIHADHNAKKGILTYRMQDKRLNLPAYTGLHIDGLKVWIVLKDGGIRDLPNLYEGYALDRADKYQIIFKKATNVPTN